MTGRKVEIAGINVGDILDGANAGTLNVADAVGRADHLAEARALRDQERAAEIAEEEERRQSVRDRNDADAEAAHDAGNTVDGGVAAALRFRI